MILRRIAALAVTATVLAAAGAAVPVQARQATSSDDERASWINLDAVRVAGLFLLGGALVWLVVDTDEADSQ
ncbi:MAG: hypothetical protein MUF14_02580 [Hyphomonadaceae bacterium]|jgi:hypothetical protein|nr:hypothetical protein [Hyphomonadaceae bacterium]